MKMLEKICGRTLMERGTSKLILEVIGVKPLKEFLEVNDRDDLGMLNK